jgi:ATP-dependent DNA helicase RecG
MDIEQLKTLVKMGENHNLEFKKTTGLLDGAFESLCAFLNTDGGTVLIGVNNEGNIVGQEVTDKIQQNISNAISKIEPPTEIIVRYVSIDDTKERSVIVLQVLPGTHKPYFYNSCPYQREQTVTKKMPKQLYDRLIEERLQLDFAWEDIPATGYTVDDLDHKVLEGVVRKAVSINRMPDEALRQTIPEVLESLELMQDGELNNAAVVLFCKKLTPKYPQCLLQMARFKGLDRNEFLDIDDASGNVFELLEKAMLFIRRHLPVAAKIPDDKLERVETPIIPFAAIREALYNAFCHRDYSIRGGFIGLAIYDDRMEIFSHGGLPKGVTIDKIKTNFSKRRNPLIAKIFYRADLIERWGRGIQKIISTCLNAHDPEPEFFADEVEFKVTFRFPYSIKPPVIEMGGIPSIAVNLTQREQMIVEILAREGALAPKSLMVQTNNAIPMRTLKRDLYGLKSKGIIDARGETRTRVWFLVKP